MSFRFERPVAACLIPGISAPAEVVREARQISQSKFVVPPTARALGVSPDALFEWWPKLRSAMSPFKLVWAGEYFQLYANNSPIVGSP